MSDQLVAQAATYTTRLTQETDIHASGGIRTHNPSNPAAADTQDRTAVGIGHHHYYCDQIARGHNRL